MMYLTILLQSQGNMAMQQFPYVGINYCNHVFFYAAATDEKKKVEKQFKEKY